MHIYIYIYIYICISYQFKSKQIKSYHIKSNQIRSDQSKAYHIISYHIKAYHSISYHIIYKLDIDITETFTFVSPAHTPHYPPTPAVNSSTVTAGVLFVRSCTQILEKNDVLEKNDFFPLKCNPLFSKMFCLIFVQ